MAIETNPDGTCTRCGMIHDPMRCSAHKRDNSAQCRKWPIKGLTVCRLHGGASLRARRVAADYKTEQASRKALGKLSITPVANPLLELQKLAGEAVAWKSVIADKVAELDRLRYSTDGGEAIRGEVLLFERAMDRCSTVLGMIARLNIDERLAAISEAQHRMIVTAIDAGLTSAGVTGPQREAARRSVAQHLRLVASA